MRAAGAGAFTGMGVDGPPVSPALATDHHHKAEPRGMRSFGLGDSLRVRGQATTA